MMWILDFLSSSAISFCFSSIFLSMSAIKVGKLKWQAASLTAGELLYL